MSLKKLYTRQQQVEQIVQSIKTQYGLMKLGVQSQVIPLAQRQFASQDLEFSELTQSEDLGFHITEKDLIAYGIMSNQSSFVISEPVLITDKKVVI